MEDDSLPDLRIPLSGTSRTDRPLFKELFQLSDESFNRLERVLLRLVPRAEESTISKCLTIMNDGFFESFEKKQMENLAMLEAWLNKINSLLLSAKYDDGETSDTTSCDDDDDDYDDDDDDGKRANDTGVCSRKRPSDKENSATIKKRKH